jgi:hypothetical protein
MPRGRLKTVDEWVQSKKEEARQRVEKQTRLLPPGLAEQIKKAAQAERTCLFERLAEIDKSIEQLRELKAEAKAIYRAAQETVQPAARTRIRLDGSAYSIKPRAVSVASPEVIEAAKTIRNIVAHIARFEAEKHEVHNQLAEIRKVEESADRGVIPALLHVTAGWRNRVDLSGLPDPAPIARSYRIYCDPLGNPLPPEALGPDGKPLPTPDIHNARANGPLVLEE